MRLIIAAAAAGLFALTATSAFAADKPANAMTTCAASWKAMSAADQGKTTYKAYSTSCMKAGGPAAAAAPAMAVKATPVAATSAMKAASPQDRMKACAAKWNDMKKDGSAKGTTYKAFSSTCLKS